MEQPVINEKPGMAFYFDGEGPALCLDEVEIDGCTFTTAPMSLYQGIIDFCQKMIDMKPHWVASEGKLTWVEPEKET